MSMHSITSALIPPAAPCLSGGLAGLRAAVARYPERLPADYQRFCEVYGEGEVGYLDPDDGTFVPAFVVRVPGASDPDLALGPPRTDPTASAGGPEAQPRTKGMFDDLRFLAETAPEAMKDLLDGAGIEAALGRFRRQEATRRPASPRLWLELVTTARGGRLGWVVDAEADDLFVTSGDGGAWEFGLRRFQTLLTEVARGEPGGHAGLLGACRGLPLVFRPADWESRSPAWVPAPPPEDARAPERDRARGWDPRWSPQLDDDEVVSAFTVPDPRDEALRSRARPAWLPVAEVRSATVDGAKVGGDAWVSEAAPWPVCGVCRRPMQLLLQLPSAALPADLEGALDGGTLQVFACLSAVPRCDLQVVDGPDAPSTMVLRLVDPSASAPLPRDRDGGPTQRIPEVAILRFRRRDDTPDPGEIDAEAPAPELVAGDAAAQRRLREALLDAGVVAAVGPPHGGDKLGGWPRAGERVTRPRCPRCKAAMRLLWQLAGGQLQPKTWGDGALGHVFQCPTHHAELSFRAF